VLMFIGFTGHAFNIAEVKELATGDGLKIGSYDLRMVNLAQGENDNYAWHRATLQVTKNGQQLGSLEPERRFYIASKESTSQIGIRQRPNEDLYLNFAGMSDDNKRAVIQAYVFPLVAWIWVGGLVLISGTLICLVPSKVKMQYARTEVVGITKAHAPVEK
jgi:cytochrome c-type biogenesis protein CcmF